MRLRRPPAAFTDLREGDKDFLVRAEAKVGYPAAPGGPAGRRGLCSFEVRAVWIQPETKHQNIDAVPLIHT